MKESNIKVTIIGWYGTETIGDRAILAGIIKLLSEAYDNTFEINLGSIYTFLTERTLLEDYDFYKKISSNKLTKISVFYSLSRTELNKNIKASSILLIGGGPLMDIHPMYMLLHAFKFSKKCGVKTVVMGCGWGPLSDNKYISITKQIIEMADAVIFRDQQSVVECRKVTGKFNNEPVGLVDPAIFAAQYFRSTRSNRSLMNCISVNFREQFVSDLADKSLFSIDFCVSVVKQLLEIQSDMLIKLIPMHTFYEGGDDRILLNKVHQAIGNDRVIVQNTPLSLEETMDVYYNSYICVGMRYHSILLQTYLNGKNYILDYTDPKKGKTINFLNQLSILENFKDRYISYSSNGSLNLQENVTPILLSESIINMYSTQYIEQLQRLL